MLDQQSIMISPPIQVRRDLTCIRGSLILRLHLFVLLVLLNNALLLKAVTRQEEKQIERHIEQRSSIKLPEASSIIGYDINGNTMSSIHNHLPEISPSMSSYQVDPMKMAASHHHKKGAKGWLDMGAWTKKKGAFGWYADFPVGGKGRR